MEEPLPYFQSHDQYNYGRGGPLYVADMLELQSIDQKTRKFLDDGNFAITEHSFPFTAFDPDYCIEQEHKKMTMTAGFNGITGTEHALEKYFIVAPTLCRVAQEFKNSAGIETIGQISLHHELIGGKSHKLLENVVKVIKIITKKGNFFLK